MRVLHLPAPKDATILPPKTSSFYEEHSSPRRSCLWVLFSPSAQPTPKHPCLCPMDIAQMTRSSDLF